MTRCGRRSSTSTQLRSQDRGHPRSRVVGRDDEDQADDEAGPDEDEDGADVLVPAGCGRALWRRAWPATRSGRPSCRGEHRSGWPVTWVGPLVETIGIRTQDPLPASRANGGHRVCRAGRHRVSHGIKWPGPAEPCGPSVAQMSAVLGAVPRPGSTGSDNVGAVEAEKEAHPLRPDRAAARCTQHLRARSPAIPAGHLCASRAVRPGDLGEWNEWPRQKDLMQRQPPWSRLLLSEAYSSGAAVSS